MKIQISRQFAKDTGKLNDARIQAKIRKVLEEAQAAQSLAEIADIEPMEGHPGFYRIKFDYRYRMGIYSDGETVQFLRVGARGDFYKRFP